MPNSPNPFSARNSGEPSSPSAWAAMRAEDEEKSGSMFGARPSAAKSQRSSTSLEGIAMLKAGCPALKYGKQGAPHKDMFLLSADEKTLSWAGTGFAAMVSKRRNVRLGEVRRLLVGRESVVFERYRGQPSAPGLTHLSISLRFDSGSAAPAAASAAGSGPPAPTVRESPVPTGFERDTLDVSFDDELTFGLWVAALRVLLPPCRSRLPI